MNPNLALLLEAIVTQARLDAPRDAAAAEWLALLDHPRYGTPPPITPAAVRAARASSRRAANPLQGSKKRGAHPGR